MKNIFFILPIVLISCFLYSCSKLTHKITIDVLHTHKLEDCENMLDFTSLGNNKILINNKDAPFFSVFFYNKNKFYLETRFGNQGAGPNEFQYITSIFFDNKNISIIDWVNNRISHYQYKDNEFIYCGIQERKNIISMNKYMEDVLFQNYTYSTDILLFSNKKTILNKRKINTDPSLNLFANYLKIRTDENFLYVFFPNIGDFFVFDNNYKVIKKIDISKVFKIKDFELKKINNRIVENRIFSDFFLYKNFILFYKIVSKNANEYTEIHPLNWRDVKIFDTIVMENKIIYIDKYNDKYLALEDDNILILDINLTNE
jgi:hypothetical protein